MKKKIIFWAVVVVLLVALGIFLKYASLLGVTVVTILVGIGGLVLGWIAHILYGKYVKQ